MSKFQHLLNHHTPLERLLEKTIGEPVEALPVPVRDIHDPDKCPVHLLPWLSGKLSVDYWKDDWSEQTKRNVIKASIPVHRKKGTRYAVKHAIAATGVDAEIVVDRNKPDYVPHSFDVKINADTHYPNAENIKDIRYQIDHTNATRCNYDLIYKSQINTTDNAIATQLNSRLKQQATIYLRQRIALSTTPSRLLQIETRIKQKQQSHAKHHARFAANQPMQCQIFTRLREAA